MEIGSGARIGPYEVTTLIGEGGMGKVYRATDTRLKRTVAIKVLPEMVATDPDRLARFQREAEMLARLNHPNIAQIHGLEESDGATALVMELVDGPTLAERITFGALPVDEALPLAKQIAEALEAAHEQGIIHRDLKPANIKIRPDGVVKVLDFGLAKALADESSSAASHSLTHSPTLTTPVAVTGVGVLLGTAAYMAPEQARGRAVDKRADIWAFGCVLFEMLTGKSTFAGEDTAETIGAIIHKEPPWSDLPTATPRSARSILVRCLEKDPRNRLRDIGEARIALDRNGPALDEKAERPAYSRFRWLPWTWAVAATAVAMFLLSPQPDPHSHPVTRFSISAPAGSSFPIPAAMMALSPDGQNLAFVAVDARGRSGLWYRRLDANDAVSLAGTEGASDPFWSPDSRSVGFFTDVSLFSVDVSSGRLQKLWDGDGNGGTWRRDGLIVFSTADGLYSVPASGGQPATVLDGVRAPGQRSWHSPKFLPDGRTIMYVARSQDDPSYRAYVTTLEGETPKYLMDVESKVEYAEPGWIVFVANGRLLARRFDPEEQASVGEPIALAGDLLGASFNGRKAFTVSDGGVLAFRERPGDSRLELRDRSGKVLDQVGNAGDLHPVAFSADDRRLLFRRNGDVWTLNLVSGREDRITFDLSSEAVPTTPIWSPDAAWIAFRRGGRIWRIRSNGGGKEEDLGGARGALLQWLPDSLAFVSESGGADGIHLTWPQGEGGKRLPDLPPGTREGQVSEI